MYNEKSRIDAVSTLLFSWHQRCKNFFLAPIKKKIPGNPVKNAAAYDTERLLLLYYFFKTHNPRLINESGFKLRVAYDGARTVHTLRLTIFESRQISMYKCGSKIVFPNYIRKDSCFFRTIILPDV